MNIFDELEGYDGTRINDKNVIRDGLICFFCVALIIIIMLILG